MAYILSDQNSIPIRVSIFNGKDKASPLFSVKEFGNTCIMYSMDKILEYGDAINIIQADERGGYQKEWMLHYLIMNPSMKQF